MFFKKERKSYNEASQYRTTLPDITLLLTNEYLLSSGKQTAVSVELPKLAFDCPGNYQGAVRHAVYKGQCSVSQNDLSTEDISYAWVTLVYQAWNFFFPLGNRI